MPDRKLGLKPISTRYLVWCTCTAYQLQRRRNSRPRATSSARCGCARPTSSRSMPIPGRPRSRIGCAERADAASPSGSSPISSGRLRSSRLIGPSTTSTSMPSAEQAVRQPAARSCVCIHGSSMIEPTPTPANAMPDRQPAAADEPVGQEQRLTGIAEADAAGADQYPEVR